MVDGVKIEGHYEKSGEFVVSSAFRSKANVDSKGFLMAAGGGKVVNTKIKDRMKKRELQSKNAGGSSVTRKGLKSGNDGRKNRSVSRGSLEEHVNPA